MVCADKADIEFLVYKEDDGNNAVVVALYVEDVTVVAHIVNGAEGLAHIGQVPPEGFINLLIPFSQRLLGIGMDVYEVAQSGKRYYSHRLVAALDVCKGNDFVLIPKEKGNYFNTIRAALTYGARP